MADNRMLALLGLLAVAGWQNRDKLQSIFANMTGRGGDNLSGRDSSAANRLDYDADGSRTSSRSASEQARGGFGDLFGNLGGLLGGATAGGGLGGALNDLLG